MIELKSEIQLKYPNLSLEEVMSILNPLMKEYVIGHVDFIETKIGNIQLHIVGNRKEQE